MHSRVIGLIFEGKSCFNVGGKKLKTSRPSSAIAEKDHAQGGLVMAKSGRLELGDNIYGYYRSTFNHCEVFGQQNNQIQ